MKAWTLCLILSFAIATTALAKGQPSNKGNGFSTRHSFEGSNIKGNLQSGALRKIVVEDDKSLEDLLGVRKKFDDREADEEERILSW